MEMQPESRFTFNPDTKYQETAKICVVGVGGGGGNAVNSMINHGLEAVEFMVVNTDSQDLNKSLAPNKIQAGRELTQGLGAGARPEIGAQAMMECVEEVKTALHGYDLVFVTAGMGGGTGTGGIPIVADIARELGILVVAIVTKPFKFEGAKRMDFALRGIDRLNNHVDTMIVIPNERLMDISEEDTEVSEAFKLADDVLGNATRGISDLITQTGYINLDFADVSTTIKNSGTALMGVASGDLKTGAASITLEAISSPLMDGASIAGARNVLVNLTGGTLPMKEMNAAMSVIKDEAGIGTEVITGLVIDDSMAGKLRITVIATGFEQETIKPTSTIQTISPDEPGKGYKGRDNLTTLDIPTHVRTGKPDVKENTTSGNTTILHLDDDDADSAPKTMMPTETTRKKPRNMPEFLGNFLD